MSLSGGPVCPCVAALRPVVRQLDEGGEISGDVVRHLVPDFRLDEVTAGLLDGDRLGDYELGFPWADRKLLAVEYQELGTCLLEGQPPEVTALMGRQELAMVKAALESGGDQPHGAHRRNRGGAHGRVRGPDQRVMEF